MILLSCPIIRLLSFLLIAALVNGISYDFSETSGGAGGTVFWVTSTGDDAGDDSTLRGAIAAAIDSGDPSVIRFDIPCKAPVIELESELNVAFAKRLTIDGSDQDGGVTVAHYAAVFRASKHVALRHLRFRPGRKGADEKNDLKCKCKPDCDVGADKEKCGTGIDALRVVTGKNWVIEHCSFGLGSDESFSVEGSRRVIVRRNIVGSGITSGGEPHYERQGLGEDPTADYHNYGSLFQGNDDLVAHDNLWSGFQTRCPQIVSSSYCCVKGEEDGGLVKLLDDSEKCPPGTSFCWGQNPSPRTYLFNNVMACAGRGTTLKGLRGRINMWKNVYLNDDKKGLEKSILLIDGTCSGIESEKHAFERKFKDVDDDDKRDYPRGGDTECGDDPDKDGMDDDSDPEKALADAVLLAGALPRDDFDDRIIDDLVNNNYDIPELDGYYPVPVNPAECS